MKLYRGQNSGFFNSYNLAPWYPYLTSIKTVIIEDGVTHIGKNAFTYSYDYYSNIQQIIVKSTDLCIDWYVRG